MTKTQEKNKEKALYAKNKRDQLIADLNILEEIPITVLAEVFKLHKSTVFRISKGRYWDVKKMGLIK